MFLKDFSAFEHLLQNQHCKLNYSVFLSTLHRIWWIMFSVLKTEISLHSGQHLLLLHHVAGQTNAVSYTENGGERVNSTCRADSCRTTAHKN